MTGSTPPVVAPGSGGSLGTQVRAGPPAARGLRRPRTGLTCARTSPVGHGVPGPCQGCGTPSPVACWSRPGTPAIVVLELDGIQLQHGPPWQDGHRRTHWPWLRECTSILPSQCLSSSVSLPCWRLMLSIYPVRLQPGAGVPGQTSKQQVQDPSTPLAASGGCHGLRWNPCVQLPRAAEPAYAVRGPPGPPWTVASPTSEFPR